MTKKTVDLIIRATDKASKDIKKITDTLKVFVDEQGDVEEGAKKADNGLTDLGSSLKRLKTAVDGVNIGSKLTGQLNKANAATTGLDRKIAELSKEYGNLNKRLSQTAARLVDVARKTKGAAAAEQRAKAALQSRIATQKRANAALTSALAVNQKLISQIKKFETSLVASNKSLAKATERHNKWQSEIAQSGKATKAQQAGLDRAAASIKKYEAAIAGLNDDLRLSKIVQNDAKVVLKGVTQAHDKATAALNRQSVIVKKIAANHALLKQSTQALGVQQGKLRSAVDRVGRSLTSNRGKLKTVTAEERKQTVQTNSLAAAYRKLYGDSRRALSVTQRLRGQVLSLIAAYAGFTGVVNILGRVVGAYQTLEGAQARLNVVFRGDEGRVAQEMEFLRRTANRLGVDLGVLSNEYSKFSIATQDTSLAGEKTKNIFLAVAEAAVVNRSTVEEMSGVFVALTQIVSKGAVQMEELRQQLGDRLPGAIKIMADGLGVTTAELVKMMEQGQVTADALVPFAEELKRRFGPGLEQSLLGVTVQIGRMKNAIFQALVAFGEQGFLESFSVLMNDITETIQSADFEEFSSKLSTAFGTLANVLGVLIKNFDKIVIVISGVIGVKLVPFIFAATAGFTKLIGVVKTVGVALLGARSATVAMTVAIRGLLSATGLGLAITAISIAIGVWATNADKATKALNAHRKVIDEVKGAYLEADKASSDWYKNLSKATKSQLLSHLRELRETISDLRDDATPSLFGRDIIKGNDELREIIETFRAGGISADVYVKRLEALAVAAGDPEFTAFIARLQDMVGELIDVEQAALETEAAIILMGDNISPAMRRAAEAILGVATALDDGTDAAFEAAASLKLYEAALDGILGKIPRLADELSTLAELAKLDSEYETIIQQALNLSPEQIREAIARYNEASAAIKAGGAVSGGLVDKIIGVESGGDPNARNPNSTATGLGQFIESTWLSMFKTYFPDRAANLSDAMILALRTDAKISRDLVGFYIQENAKLLQTAGVAVNEATLYLAHFLGPNAAKEVLQAAPNTPVADILSPKVIDANQSILGGDADVQQLLDWAVQKVGITREQLAVDQHIADVETKRRETQQDFNDGLSAAVEMADLELSLVEKNVVEREVALALYEAETKAAEDGLALTALQRSEIERITEEKFKQQLLDDRADAVRERAADAEKKVNELISERGALYSQLEFANANGDSDKAVELQTRIEAINAELVDAITNAQNMWEAVGGSEAVAAIAVLELARAEAANFGQEADKVYLQWDRIGDLFVSKMASAFDSFSKKVNDGASIWDAARSSFLQFAGDFLREIAQMIIKQAIFNALKSAFGGTDFGALIGINHDGGLAGSGAQRSGVNPAVFAGALRYHEGGIAGLRPGELPIIVEEEEEILTRGDSRHVLNGGKSAGRGQSAAPVVDLKVVIPMSPAQILREAVADREGQEVLLEEFQNNSNEYKAALGMQ